MLAFVALAALNNAHAANVAAVTAQKQAEETGRTNREANAAAAKVALEKLKSQVLVEGQVTERERIKADSSVKILIEQENTVRHQDMSSRILGLANTNKELVLGVTSANKEMALATTKEKGLTDRLSLDKLESMTNHAASLNKEIELAKNDNQRLIIIQKDQLKGTFYKDFFTAIPSLSVGIKEIIHESRAA